MNAIAENNEQKTLELAIPAKLHFLMSEPARYKILYGGRGGAKTETMARVLLVLASQKRLRIACFREFQNSLDESSLSTLENCIKDMWGVEHYAEEWDIQRGRIISKRTGSEFIFFGLRYKIEALKSLARIDIAWTDEARNCSKVTLDKLGPTIRGIKVDGVSAGGPFGKGPELWFSYNPELDTDEIYKRSVLKPEQYFPEYIFNKETGKQERYAIIVKINHSDNPFLPEDMRQQMEVARSANEDDFLHIWEGNTKQVLEGAIYAKEIKKVLLEGRRGKVPYNSNKPVFTFWDLGRSDKTAIWFIQHAGVEFNVIDYYENRLEKMPHYIKILQERQYTYATHYLPHDGDAETLSNVTPKKQMQAAFPNCNVRIVERPSKKMVGINAARTVFDLCNFDEDKTSDGWQCLCNYAYKVDADNGQFSKEPDHDTPWSHGADGWQTFALSLKGEKDKKKSTVEGPKTVGSNSNTVRNLHRGTGWMNI